MIEAFVKAQFLALSAKNNKERLGYMIAGIKDGKFYDLTTDVDYGTFDVDAPDAEFITQADLEMSRVATTKIQSVTASMVDYFAKYNSDEVIDVEVVEDEVVEDEVVEDEIDYEALETECKKSIKKGKLSKAQKLLAKLEGQDCHKKLSKKLKKASE